MADTEVETADNKADADIGVAFDDLKGRIKANVPATAFISFLIMISKTTFFALTVKSTFYPYLKNN